MNMTKKILIAAVLFLSLGSGVFAGQLSLGGQFDAWSTNYVQPFNGWEVWAPLSFSFKVSPLLGFYGQTEYGNGGYTDSTFGTNTQYLNNFSDSVAGAELSFKSFGVNSTFNLGFNIPTGDTGWEQRQIASSVPTDFIASRYWGRGFGVNAMYALAFPAGGAQFGAAAGYSYSGNYNPNSGTGSPETDLKLGDTVFLAFNLVQPYPGDQSQIIRLSGLLSLDTQIDSQNVFQMGPNLNASYSWINPKALSFDLGIQYFLPGQRQVDGSFTGEPNNFYGARFYLTPSYAFGDFTLAAAVKYILPNGYAETDALYNDGGYLLGLHPSFRLPLDASSALRFSAGFDDILAQNYGVDANTNLTDVNYNYWSFGTSYEIKL